MTITNEMIEDVISILKSSEGTDEECFADEDVVDVLMDEYGLPITDAHAVLERASNIWDYRKSSTNN